MEIESLWCQFSRSASCYRLEATEASSSGLADWFGGLTRDGQLYQSKLGPFCREPVPQTQMCTWRLLDIHPGIDEWRRLCRRAATELDRGPLRKVVLTQQRYYQPQGLEQPAWPYLPALKHPKNISFCFQASAGRYFGVSPEILFRRRGGQLSTEAVSGTIAMGSDRPETLFKTLLSDRCKRNELEVTVEGICDGLVSAGACSIRLGEIRWRKAGNLMHLQRSIHANIEQPDDINLLKQLHPSPAVCGWPKAHSKALRHSLEGPTSDWYAGAVGWSTPKSACFWVVLRAGAIHNNVAKVTCGIGLVSGFCPEAEWQELESKHCAWLAQQR